MPAIWDPLFWWLWFQGRRLKRLGFLRHKARVRGAPFAYYMGGDPESAPPLVFVHGLALFPEWWNPLLKRLPAGTPACALELLGFGRSPGRRLPRDAFTLSLYREQLDLMIEKLGDKPVILVGVSLGGWVCLDYALARPDRVAGLILYAPAGAEPNVREPELQTLRRLFDYRTPAEFNHLINDYVLYRPRRLPWMMGYMALKRAQWNGHKALLNNLAADDWIGERTRKITAPTGLIWGNEDKVFPIATGEALAADMPRARLFPLERAGHSYLFEAPDASCKAFFEAMEFVRGCTEA